MKPSSKFTATVAFILTSWISTTGCTPVNAAPLSGGIEHAEKLPNVSEKLVLGKPFDDKLLPKSEAGKWFEIPTWLAGTWQSIQVIRTSNYDDKTGATDTKPTIENIRESDHFGYQIDRKKNIWSMKYVPTPITQEAEIKNPEPGQKPEVIPAVKYIFRQNSMISSDDKEATIKTIDLVITVRNDTKQMAQIEQREAIRRFTVMDKDLVAVTTDSQSYDQFGLPKARTKLAEFRSKTRDFEVIHEIKNGSIFASFKNYLQENGKLNLAPEKE